MEDGVGVELSEEIKGARVFRMRRRALILGLGIITARWSLYAAEASGLKHIGVIDNAPIWDNFRRELAELGEIEGRTIAFEYRRAEGEPDRLLAAARELSSIPVDVIAIFGSTAALAAKAATDSVPVVAISIGDPVGIGLVASLAHPGGNVTGNTILGPDLVQKRLQLLLEMLPGLERVAFIWNPNNASNHALLAQLQEIAPRFGVAVISTEVRLADDFRPALEDLAAKRPDALITTNDPVHQRNIQKIIEFQNEKHIPGMFQIKEQVDAGGLLSYGASLPDLFRRGGNYVHRILRGTPPANLPIEQPTTYELAINLKTAKALGLTVPQLLLARADEIIE